MKNNNEKTESEANQRRFYQVAFEIDHDLPDGTTTEEKAKHAFMHSYLCLSAILWSVGKINYFYKNEQFSAETTTLLEHNEYLCLIGAALLEDMSKRMQLEYFLNGGQADEK